MNIAKNLAYASFFCLCIVATYVAGIQHGKHIKVQVPTESTRVAESYKESFHCMGTVTNIQRNKDNENLSVCISNGIGKLDVLTIIEKDTVVLDDVFVTSRKLWNHWDSNHFNKNYQYLELRAINIGENRQKFLIYTNGKVQ